MNELFLFGTTLLLGIFSAYNFIPLIEKSIIEPPSFSWDGIVIFLAFFTILSLILTKFKKINGVFLKFFLLIVVFSGSQIIFGSVVSSPTDLFLALLIAFIFLTVHNVLEL